MAAKNKEAETGQKKRRGVLNCRAAVVAVNDMKPSERMQETPLESSDDVCWRAAMSREKGRGMKLRAFEHVRGRIWIGGRWQAIRDGHGLKIVKAPGQERRVRTEQSVHS